MNLTPTAQATLLLTSYFSKSSKQANNNVQPLTASEWGRFALWLHKQDKTPADLLLAEPATLLSDWQDEHISLSRISQLLSRGHSLAIALEKWQRAGLWVVTRSDPDYPNRLKRQLKTAAPPVLFGCGNKQYLNAGGLALVSSVKASAADLSFASEIGAKAAAAGVTIVSSGNQGVDETAMLGALEQGGKAIGVLADNLLKAATSAKWRKGLMAGQLQLVSTVHPEASFNMANATDRNKYIYCLADQALVIHAAKAGSTFSGAEENLKNAWVPLWVKQTTDTEAGNEYLVSQGGRWYEPADDEL